MPGAGGDGEGEGRYGPRAPFRLRAGKGGGGVAFGPLGYAAAARASYEVFAALRSAGALPGHCRLQVCLPTPLAPVVLFVDRESQPAVEPAYEAAIAAELETILAAVPHGDLAIQWDTAVEFGVLEGVFPSPLRHDEDGIVGRLARLAHLVPSDVEVGFHLCYGDGGHRHFTEPADTGRLVNVANGVLDGLTRPLTWLHLPVPRNRDDDAYFEPMRKLALPAGTELYLGLVHLTDGA